MENITAGALLQRDKTTYAIKPRTPLGVLTPELLRLVADVAERFGIPSVKMTSGQRLILIGIRPEDLPAVQDALGDMGEICKHYVQACPGTDYCAYGVQDSMALGAKVEDLLRELKAPAKLKIGVSGCSFSCGESHVRDIGYIGKNSGWTILFGGNSARRPRQGEVVAKGLDDVAALETIRKLLDYYCANAKDHERTARFADRVGIETIRAAVGR